MKSRLANTLPRKPPTRQLRLDESLPVGSRERSKLKKNFVPRLIHGGQSTANKRKESRPFVANLPVHLVLKSSRAKGQWSLNHHRNRSKIQSILYTHADRLKVRILRSQNVGNHLHLLVKSAEKKPLQDFLRIITGRIAVTITGAKKGVKKLSEHPHIQTQSQYKRKFWDGLSWSRLVNWGKEFFQVSQYIQKNQFDLLPQGTREIIASAWDNFDQIKTSALNRGS